ncbi:glutamate carboxypeptidase 2 [Delitschia confertaspora ATCC 74209]|uniref:Glutamate carboxypeptidase 2 n=1 Tax=Delitschia confertaspora ATCC 74209 TaxID=1513339 RepID=A0A9P4MQW1_9PLEO|nr:glutamate carboxypeptidase 2 [Delitschia confertaspora ATCC 74209]
MKSILILLAAIGAQACQPKDLRDISLRRHKREFKREFEREEKAPFPPDWDEAEQILLNSFDNTTIDQWAYYYTHGAHLAGTNKTMAQWTADRWAEFGWTSRLDEYYIYLNYPVSHSMQLSYSNGSTFTPSLEEAVLIEDETSSYPNRIPTFNGYSASGNASAEYVYIGRGQQVDFNRLKTLGIETEGKIGIAKYGGPFRGLKVKNAQEHGMIGVVIFSDPSDDGNVTEAKGVATYPNGPARNPTSVQRGSVQFLSIYPGDPTTPGYASKVDSPRSDKSENVPKIPSIPISWLDAQPILQSLNGHGPAGKEVNRTGWVGAIPGVTYNTGPVPGATLSMSNIMEDKYNWIWNTIGIINGTNNDEVVIVGNHRDAWIVGGAADPNSGSAVMVEMAKAFGKLLETGWKPTRTIILCSWDAEEYGTVGSTEWVEEYVPWLAGAAVSYLNVDVAVSGPIPDMSASPELHSIGTSIMKKIIYPYRGSTNQTMYDIWSTEGSGEIGVLGSGSDYTAFIHRGIGSLDIGAGGGKEDPVYHYHSNYDSYHWMTKFGDPGFVTHKSIGQYLTLLTYHLANDASLPLEPANFATEMKAYLEELEDTISTANATLNLGDLTEAIDAFEKYSSQFNSLREEALSTNDADLLKVVNHKARDFQRGFTSQGGLPGREFYRHIVFAPGLDTGYAPVTFPGVTEAVMEGNLTLAQEWLGKTAKGISVAANILKT